MIDIFLLCIINFLLINQNQNILIIYIINYWFSSYYSSLHYCSNMDTVKALHVHFGISQILGLCCIFWSGPIYNRTIYISNRVLLFSILMSVSLPFLMLYVSYNSLNASVSSFVTFLKFLTNIFAYIIIYATNILKRHKFRQLFNFFNNRIGDNSIFWQKKFTFLRRLHFFLLFLNCIFSVTLLAYKILQMIVDQSESWMTYINISTVILITFIISHMTTSYILFIQIIKYEIMKINNNLEKLLVEGK